MRPCCEETRVLSLNLEVQIVNACGLPVRQLLLPHFLRLASRLADGSVVSRPQLQEQRGWRQVVWCGLRRPGVHTSCAWLTTRSLPD